MKRLRVVAWATAVIAAVCVLTAAQLIVNVWTYKERKGTR